MAQFTITVPDSALPHLAEVKAETEARLRASLTNVQFTQFVVREYVLRVKRELALRAAHSIQAIEADYPELG